MDCTLDFDEDQLSAPLGLGAFRSDESISLKKTWSASATGLPALVHTFIIHTFSATGLPALA